MSNQYVNKVVQSNGTTLIDISDTTAVAADVASGKYFYLATGEKVEGTSPGGSTAAISVVDTLDSHGGTVREITALDISDTTAVASDVAIGKYFYTANGTKTAGINNGGSGTPSQTQHTIYFEFSDNTDATITAYWNETFVSDAIRATIPTTYGQKTVESASLDGLAWYTKPTETWEVLLDGNVGFYADETDYPYCWIADLADVEIPVGSIWRITFDGSVYRCVVTIDDASYGGGIIGNPKYNGDTDDGSEVPFCLYHSSWGAWLGGADVEKESYHAVKIERLVTS